MPCPPPAPRDADRPALRVLVLAADPASTLTRLRITDPLSRVLASRGGEWRASPLHDTPSDACAGFHVVVVQRGMTRRHLGLLQAAVAQGCAVVYEIDDLLTEPAAHLQHAVALREGARWVRAALQAADVVTVSTERLAALLQLTPEQHLVVPNAAFDGPGLPAPGPRAGSPLTLLVAGSDRVAGGAAWPALRDVVRAAGGRVTVQAVGPVAEDLARAGVPCERLPLMPREAFVRWAASQPDALALIPLDDSRFSAGKSAVKWFDYAVAGVPTLASDVPPYRDVIEHGRTGWLVGPAAANWQTVLGVACADAAVRTRIADAARQQVQARHHAGLTAEAWGRALDVARARAAARGAVPGRGELPRAGLAGALEDLGRALRRWNRERLARRKTPG